MLNKLHSACKSRLDHQAVHLVQLEPSHQLIPVYTLGIGQKEHLLDLVEFVLRHKFDQYLDILHSYLLLESGAVDKMAVAVVAALVVGEDSRVQARRRYIVVG